MLRIDDITDQVSKYIQKPNLEIIYRAYVFSAKVHKGQLRSSGEPYLTHPLNVSSILADLRMDEVTIAIGLLHDTVEDTLASLPEIRQLFGEEVESLVSGVTKISKINFRTEEESQAENYRKLILAMADDIRVIIIKLADRLHNMRTLEFLPPDKQRRIAQETMDIYAPFANRLGIAKIKSELEDLSFKILEPQIYEQLHRKTHETKNQQSKVIDLAIHKIEEECTKASIPCEVYGRDKHYFSIYQKMLNKALPFDQIFDRRGVRVITKTEKNCYEIIGAIHSIWKPKPGEFDDYIGMPKPNMYQSLHTIVIGPESQPLEVQVRTKEMHRVAEEGIAAHWLYKEKGKRDKLYNEKLKYLHQRMKWLQELTDPKEFLKMIKMDLFHDEVFVFTPKGQVKAFPKDATVVDFAYSIHTEVGNHCMGVKVNGKIEPLSYKLKTGDIIQIITSLKQKPNRDWLKFVKTTKALQRIKHWLKIKEKERSISLGRDILDKEARKYGLNYNNIFHQGNLFSDIARKCNVKTTYELLAFIGLGKISAKHVISMILPRDLKESSTKPKTIKQKKAEGVKIQGLDDIVVRFAKCCNPIAGDDIIGFISRRAGISIHRTSCINAKSLCFGSDRQLEVQWDNKNNKSYSVDIMVISEDKLGLLAQITKAISDYQANIISADVKTAENQTAVTKLKVKLNNVNELNELLSILRKLESIISVERLE